MSIIPEQDDSSQKIIKKVIEKGPYNGLELTHPQTPEKTTDPDKLRSMVEIHRNRGGKIIFEVGFGGKFCAGLSKGCLAVGIDPMNAYSVDRKVLKDLEMDACSERLFYNLSVSEVPDGIYPDVVIMVAPSPETIDDILLELQSKIGNMTKLAFFIENQSQQAVDDGRALEIVEKIKKFFRSVHMEYEVELEATNLEEDFSDYLTALGVNGGVLNTTPWEGSGDWMVVTSI